MYISVFWLYNKAHFIEINHWGRVTHICVGNLTIIGPDNGLSPGRRQAIIWTNAGILWIGPWGTNFSEILIGIHTFSFKKFNFQMSSGKWRPSCLGLNVLRTWISDCIHSFIWDVSFVCSNSMGRINRYQISTNQHNQSEKREHLECTATLLHVGHFAVMD